jgi:hypothetical protein
MDNDHLTNNWNFTIFEVNSISRYYYFSWLDLRRVCSKTMNHTWISKDWRRIVCLEATGSCNHNTWDWQLSEYKGWKNSSYWSNGHCPSLSSVWSNTTSSYVQLSCATAMCYDILSIITMMIIIIIITMIIIMKINNNDDNNENQ